MNANQPDRSLETLRQALWTGIPVTSALLFIAVAIKVFRAAHMETSTTVAIVKSADVVALSKGVIVTLLPGFLASLIAFAVWLWVRTMPSESFSKEDAWRALAGPNAGLLWVVLAIGFFTVPFVVFLLIFLPVAGLALILAMRTRNPSRAPLAFRRIRKTMVALSLVTAVASTCWLAISSDVWLPLRVVRIADGHRITVSDKTIERELAAYILESNDDQITLLVDEPRAVVTVSPADLEPNPKICIPPESSLRWLLVRTSQRLGLEKDYRSPYPECPKVSS